jgi:hypothetical protein
MPELLAILEASRKNKNDERKFAAALQGVKIDDPETTRSFDDIKRRAMGWDEESNDVASIRGPLAEQEGFGVGQGLGYRVE